jgi:hypothetical protein
LLTWAAITSNVLPWWPRAVRTCSAGGGPGSASSGGAVRCTPQPGPELGAAARPPAGSCHRPASGRADRGANGSVPPPRATSWVCFVPSAPFSSIVTPIPFPPPVFQAPKLAPPCLERSLNVGYMTSDAMTSIRSTPFRLFGLDALHDVGDVLRVALCRTRPRSDGGNLPFTQTTFGSILPLNPASLAKSPSLVKVGSLDLSRSACFIQPAGRRIRRIRRPLQC